MPKSSAARWRVVRGLVVPALAIWLLHGASAPAARAESSACLWPLRPQDTVWLVSSRGIGSCNVEENLSQLKCWRFDPQRAWTRAELAELIGTGDPDVITVVFLHGNRVSSCDAFAAGWASYRRLARCADERPIRFVAWSWPSTKVCGPVQDVRIKAARTNVHGYYVAWFLDQFDREAPVSLWGFSYGARIATGALHLLGGGTLVGRRLDVQHPERRPIRAALMAAALDDDWLLPGRRHGQAPARLGDMLLVNNGCDRVLARYHLLYGRGCCRDALGYAGLPVWRLPAEDAQKVRQMNACCYVGNQHTFDNYLASPQVMAGVREALLGASPPAEPAAGEPTADDEPQVELVTP